MGKFDQDWKNPPRSVQLLPDEIHLWRLDLDSSRTAEISEGSLLSKDELARAARFHFERDRRTFSETRIALRRILGQYLCISPHEIRFDYRENGKPEISESQNRKCIRFNVSHSGRFSIIGVSLERRIGVDVEKYRTMDYLEIARRYFSEREYDELKAARAAKLQYRFFSCWTRKEALLKALGEGIGNLLDQVSVSIGNGQPRLIDFSGNPGALQVWSLLDVNLEIDYAAAIAFEGKSFHIHYWNYQAFEGHT